VLAYHSGSLQPSQETLLQALANTRRLEQLPSLEDLRERIALHLSAPGPEHVLPLTQGPTETPDSNETPAQPARDLTGRKILVVDDDARNVYALTNILELHGIQVVHADNGREGIDRLVRDSDFDLVLMDVMMPEMDGYTATTAIRAMPRYAELPIIAVTAKAMHGDREKSLNSGATDYVTKPVDAEQLLQRIQHWLGGTADDSVFTE
jgi:CheY-like chemotaxis protein